MNIKVWFDRVDEREFRRKRMLSDESRLAALNDFHQRVTLSMLEHTATFPKVETNFSLTDGGCWIGVGFFYLTDNGNSPDIVYDPTASALRDACAQHASGMLFEAHAASSKNRR